MSDLTTLLKQIYTDGAVGYPRNLEADAAEVTRLVHVEQMNRAREARKAAKPTVTTFQYKDIELEDYKLDEQSKIDKKITKGLVTGDYSDLIEKKETK